ncbi:MAG: pseudouridine synthase [Microcystaceae cyanobacterium]
MTERVQKILSQWGIASRRHAEELILEGRVRLNGKLVKLGDKADPARDRLEVDGKKIEIIARPKLVYLLLNKPKGVLSTCDDPRERKTVLDLLPQYLREGQGIHPVGRLDRNTTGALLLTNDGELTQRLTHPRYHLPKTYDLVIAGHPTEEQLEEWRRGLMLDDSLTLPAQIEVIDYDRSQIHLEIIIKEGRNRQIRRIVEELFELEVLKLHRRAIGDIKINSTNERLGSGQYRRLDISEVRFLKRHVQLERMSKPQTRSKPQKRSRL